jgi:hypothetical protein
VYLREAAPYVASGRRGGTFQEKVTHNDEMTSGALSGPGCPFAVLDHNLQAGTLEEVPLSKPVCGLPKAPCASRASVKLE